MTKLVRSESIIEISKALMKFHEIVEQPKKTEYNQFNNSHYAPFDGIVNSINAAAPKCGLSYTEIPIFEDGRAGVSTLLMHESGEFMEYPAFLLPTGKGDAQAVGSAVTYSRRYGLSAIFGLAAEADDDGVEAKKAADEFTQQQQQQTQQIDREQVLGTIENLILELAELQGEEKGTSTETRDKLLKHFKTDDFSSLSDVMLTTVYQTVKASIRKVKKQNEKAAQ